MLGHTDIMIRRLLLLVMAMLMVATSCAGSEPVDDAAPIDEEAPAAEAPTVGARAEATPTVDVAPTPTPTTAPSKQPTSVASDDRDLDDVAARDGSTLGAPAPSSGDIGDVDFFNDFVYPITFDEVLEVTVTNGEYIDEPGFLWFSVLDVQYGDLDGDGADEAVVQTGFNTGGSGQFGRLAVWDVVGDRVVERGWVGTGDRADGGLWHYEIRDGQIITENFLTDQGACCPNMLHQSRFALVSDGLRSIEFVRTLRWMSLNSYDDSDTELKFLPGTSAAIVQLSAVDETNELVFEAGAGQWVTIERRRGPEAGIVIFDDSGDVVAQSANATLETELPSSGFFRVVFTNDATADVSTVVDLSITARPSSAEVAWTPAVKELVIAEDPIVRLLTVTPEFDLSDNGLLNGAIDAWMGDETDWWVADVIEYPPLEREGNGDSTGGEYELIYEVTLASDDLASFRWNWYEYVCCRPYPNYGHKAMVVDLNERRIVAVDEILDLSRLDEIHDIWLSRAGAEEILPADYLDWIGDDGPAFSSLALTPTGVEFGTDRQGAIGGTLTVVPYEALGDLLDADLVARARTGAAPIRLD